MEPRESVDARMRPRKKSMLIAVDEKFDRKMATDRDAILVIGFGSGKYLAPSERATHH